MSEFIEQKLSCLFDHYLVVNLLLALIILTHVGVGDIRIVSLLGILLCSSGILQLSPRVDLWILVPLILYNLISMASSYATYGNIIDGYASTQSLFIILYLVLACLDDRERFLLKGLCVLWTGTVALAGIGQFVVRVVFWQRAWRVGGLLGNPNAMGIFLAAGWFALLSCVPQRKEDESGWISWLSYLEPIFLLALALTLSMGSFVSMAVGILALVWGERRHSSWMEAFRYVCRLLARASLGMGTGILIYLAAARTSLPMVSLLLVLYGAAMVYCWKKYKYFLVRYPRMALVIAALGVLVAIAAIVLRPSALATFAERLEMMENGLGYFTKAPLLGVGPYQWRILNLYDDGKYFNTWHIHNVFIHIGVELGWIALVMLIIIAVRFCRKAEDPAERAGVAAFCFHNIIDTSFFYMGVLALVMLTMGNFENKARQLGVGAVRIFFTISAVVFVYNLYYSIFIM